MTLGRNLPQPLRAKASLVSLLNCCSDSFSVLRCFYSRSFPFSGLQANFMKRLMQVRSVCFLVRCSHTDALTERIADQKFALRSLVTLYRNSSDIPGRSDTLKVSNVKPMVNPRKLFKTAIKGVRAAATTTTTAFGNVAVSFPCSFHQFHVPILSFFDSLR